ncbi:hypothetical protein F0562_016279 [Nyssa sinensis]|uniref:Mitochondrial glycoprotein n=1 Tax=Nyssa sinensis TaxID=561372 RepID=A0A5J4ZP76_9ASTE|nr:hypothetical protein F0562_016279 [Nyssa sinensis]
MALNVMLRRAPSSVAHLAIRALESAATVRSATSTAFSVEHIHRWGSFAPSLHFSTTTAEEQSSKKRLIQIIDSEINCAQELKKRYRADEIPKGFPFAIQDSTGERIVVLQRKYQNEIIKVEVELPNLKNGEDGDEKDGGDESSYQPSIPLVVSISKGSGLSLQFGVTVFPDEFSIDRLSIKEPESTKNQLAYEGPNFLDLDENLQKALKEYLENRGIKPITTYYLYVYMISKDSKEYLKWLKKLKKFVES